jgi:uncharacterized protein
MLYNVAQLLKAPVGSDLRQAVEGSIDLQDDSAHVIGPVAGEVRFQRTNLGILASGEIAVTVQLQCVRCLEEFEQPLQVPFSEMFLPTIEVVSGHPLPDVTEEQGFPIDAHHHLDLTELLRQQIIVTLPDQPLCQPNCAGICPVCGNNRNLHPCDCESQEDLRWSALARLSLAEQPEMN